MKTGFLDANQHPIFIGDRVRVRHYWCHGHDAIGEVRMNNHGESYIHVDLALVNYTIGTLEKIIRIGWKVYVIEEGKE